MEFDTVESISTAGFSGFVTASILRGSGGKEIPAEKGVYLVLRLDENSPKFLPRSTGGYFKGKDPTVPVSKLKRKWVEGAKVVYIGKAGTLEGKKTLRKRIMQYLRFGQGKRVPHRGGRYIWQLGDSGDLVFCWKPTPDQDPRCAEKTLIQEFREAYGKRPFANLQD